MTTRDSYRLTLTAYETDSRLRTTITDREHALLTTLLRTLRTPNPSTPTLLALAVLEGDWSAAVGLCDWVLEEGVREGQGSGGTRAEFVEVVKEVARWRSNIPVSVWRIAQNLVGKETCLKCMGWGCESWLSSTCEGCGGEGVVELQVQGEGNGDGDCV
jgi:hypothetical protein